MKVLIVDDGHYIVEYLKHLLNWCQFGVNQVETTTNSIEAKRMLEESPTDILITDIRMPEVSGIDLLEHVSMLRLKTKVILLSGYSEFEYAQKAIRLGAFDYLLKPVDKEDMEKVIRSVTKEIAESQPESDTIREPYDSLGYLLSVLSENGVLIQECKPLSIGCEQKPMRFFKLPAADTEEMSKLREAVDGPDMFIWTTSSTLTGMIPEQDVGRVKAALPSITLSEPFQFNLKDSVRSSFYQFFYQEEVVPGDFSMLQNIDAFSKLESRKWECSRQKIQKQFPKFMHRKQKIMYLLEVIYYLYLTHDKLHAGEILDWIILRLEQPEDVYEYVMLAVSRLGREADLSNGDIIDNVRKHITGHLAEALSLEELGGIVHLHPVYLSKFYKQETGENLSSYISVKRLERAARLLNDSQLHVMDISQMVGYKKSQYFIKLFKERYGVTPQQYRKQQIKLK